MMNQAKVTKIAKTWQRIATLKRKRISFPGINNNQKEGRRTSGKFVIYTNDHERFAIPIEYSYNNIIKQLFEMSELVFGLPGEGPIKLPCDAVFMEYVVTLIEKGLAKDIERLLLMSIEPSCCSFYVDFHQQQISQQLPVFGY